MAGTIVCGVTHSVDGREAARLAASLGERLDLRVVLVHVAGANAAAMPAFAALAHELDGAEIRVVRGNRAERLARVAADEGADLILLGSRGRGLRGRQLRCTLARELEAATSVPVLVAPARARRR